MKRVREENSCLSKIYSQELGNKSCDFPMAGTSIKHSVQCVQITILKLYAYFIIILYFNLMQEWKVTLTVKTQPGLFSSLREH